VFCFIWVHKLSINIINIFLGILLITFFLSCWNVNTSAAAMMIPIVSGLIDAFDSTTNISRTKNDENDGEKRKKKLRV
jgi:di/tricarboxylate transporter